MGKNRLVIDPDYEFDLYGIITTIKEYKLAWELNKVLDIHLIKQEDFKFDLLREGPLVISNFLFETEHLQYRLLKNKPVDQSVNKTVYLLPELQKFDFLLIIKGLSKQDDDIVSKIKSIPLIDFASRFNVSELRAKENLIF